MTAYTATTVGPGSWCSGTNCANNASGIGAGVACSGSSCADSASGTFAALGCVGNECGKNSEGQMAAAHCYGKRCAEGSSGDLAGAYCIGNECGKGASNPICCVGKNCSGTTTRTCIDTHDIYTSNCGDNVDTESTAWRTFFDACAEKPDTTTNYTVTSTNCTVRCSDKLHAWLNFYSDRAATEDYARARAEESDRFGRGRRRLHRLRGLVRLWHRQLARRRRPYRRGRHELEGISGA